MSITSTAPKPSGGGRWARDVDAEYRAYLRELYGVSVGRDLISRVTDAVMDDGRAMQARPLDDVYPVVFLDCMVVKIKDGGSVARRACYIAISISMSGEREVLGLWFQDTEKGFPEAIEAIFPDTTVQTCIACT